MGKEKMRNWTIAITVAVIYLIASTVFNAWAYSWLIWVAYAIYRLIEDRMINPGLPRR